MCGIFGAVFLKSPANTDWCIEPFVSNALRIAEWRGLDAVGLAVMREGLTEVLKRPMRAGEFIQTAEYQEFLQEAQNDLGRLIGFMGHSRLSTNGSEELHENNQPVITSHSALIHNGIIVNAPRIREAYPELFRHQSELDSDVISRLLDSQISGKQELGAAIKSVYSELIGQACVAYAHGSLPGIVLFSNNGSLHYYHDVSSGVFLFASEWVMLKRMLESPDSPCGLVIENIRQLRPGSAVVAVRGYGVELIEIHANQDSLDGVRYAQQSIVRDRTKVHRVITAPSVCSHGEMKGNDHELFRFPTEKLLELRRCTRCILPASFPGISFDESGVCSMCHNYKPLRQHGIDAFLQTLAKESHTGKPGRCLVALSGGRDSCFILHYLKQVLGLDVVAFTYDWGMVTDLARRNMSRMVAALGVEHILISADIRVKRDNIRRNVEAWLHRPHPGTIPLFMAGDKQFFFYANKAARDTGSEHLIFGMNRLEATHFKTGFCGVFANGKSGTHFELSKVGQMKLLAFYAKEMLYNPGLINRSWLDTLFGFASYYVFPHRYQQFFDYYPWNESEVNETICKTYDWEVATDTSSTWRIGDGTASFYNYAYLTLTGLSEVDAFRSNQIREGQLTREQAMSIMMEENRPRLESFKWYCNTIKTDYRTALRKINAAADNVSPLCTPHA